MPTRVSRIARARRCVWARKIALKRDFEQIAIARKERDRVAVKAHKPGIIREIGCGLRPWRAMCRANEIQAEALRCLHTPACARAMDWRSMALRHLRQRICNGRTGMAAPFARRRDRAQDHGFTHKGRAASWMSTSPSAGNSAGCECLQPRLHGSPAGSPASKEARTAHLRVQAALANNATSSGWITVTMWPDMAARRHGARVWARTGLPAKHHDIAWAHRHRGESRARQQR